MSHRLSHRHDRTHHRGRGYQISAFFGRVTGSHAQIFSRGGLLKRHAEIKEIKRSVFSMPCGGPALSGAAESSNYFPFDSTGGGGIKTLRTFDLGPVGQGHSFGREIGRIIYFRSSTTSGPQLRRCSSERNHPGRFRCQGPLGKTSRNLGWGGGRLGFR